MKGRLNVIVSGGTGTGKTTTLNVLSSFIPSDERIVTVEDAKELQLHQTHVLSMEARPANIEGKGEVAIRDLVRNSLRMRPDRIVVGECRGGEALDMLQAMNTGHDGSLTTIHSNSPRDTLSLGDADPHGRLRSAAAGHPGADGLGARHDRAPHPPARRHPAHPHITHITEVQGMEGEVIVLQDVFLFDFRWGVDDDPRFRGCLKPTGVRPEFSERLADQGIRLGAEMFTPEVSPTQLPRRRR